MAAKLTAKQRRFCDEYLTDMNAAQAAIRAGYSKKTAKQIGQENLTKPDLQKYIAERMKQKESELIADQDEVLRYLTAVMRREMKESVVVTLNEKNSFYAPDETGTMRKQTVEKEVPRVIQIPARLSDANRAAEMLGKAHGIFTDRVEVDADMELNITIDYGDEE